VAELVDAPDSKFVDGRSDLFRSVLTSFDLYCENRPRAARDPISLRSLSPHYLLGNASEPGEVALPMDLPLAS
jgi:hypothetical protein